MKNKLLYSLLIITTLITSGCASIVGQSVFPVTINSNPDGATIKVTDDKGMIVFNGVTPTTVSLTAGESYFHAKSYSITFNKAGYGEQHAVIKADISGWYFGNILFGGLIGMLIIDPITGKMWKLQSSYTANLNTQTSMNSKKELQILTLDQVPKELRKDLISIN